MEVGEREKERGGGRGREGYKIMTRDRERVSINLQEMRTGTKLYQRLKYPGHE